MKTTTFRSSWLMILAGALLAPAVVLAQGARNPKRTIFFGVEPAGGFVRPDSVRRVSVDSGVPASVYEGYSAPFVADSATLERAGRCISVGPTGANEARGVLLHGTLSVALPAGAVADTQARWLLVRRGPLLPGLGLVVIPTGIVRLTSHGATGVTAQVVAQFDAMACSNAILRAADPPVTRPGRLTTVAGGPQGRVAWVASGSLLPTLQHTLILDVGGAAGLAVGDRVTVYGANGEEVAQADVVRVDARSSTALVVRQSLGSLAAGQRIRVTEKFP
ncbi:MAG TPA: hypothetical protein VFZ73_05690 [Gemmatimonadaceae bacterium]